MTIKTSVLDLIRENQRCKNRLCFKLDISPATLHRWLVSNNKKLTMMEPLQIIASELSLEVDDLLSKAEVKV